MAIKIVLKNGSEYRQTCGRYLLPKNNAVQSLLLDLREKDWYDYHVHHAAIICDVGGRKLSPVKIVKETMEGVFQSDNSLIEVVAHSNNDQIVIRLHALETNTAFAWDEITELYIGHWRDLPEGLKKYTKAFSAALLRSINVAQNKRRKTLYYAKE